VEESLTETRQLKSWLLAFAAVAVCGPWPGWDPAPLALLLVCAGLLALARPSGRARNPWFAVVIALMIAVWPSGGGYDRSRLENQLDRHCQGMLVTGEALATDSTVQRLLGAAGEVVDPAGLFAVLDRSAVATPGRTIYLADDRGQIVAWGGAGASFPYDVRPLGQRQWGISWSAGSADLWLRDPLLVDGRLVGAVIIATGSDELHTDRLAEYGCGKMSNVLTALEYERLLSGLGPTGGVVKRDDGTAAQTVAWYVMDSASPIGFMTAVTEAMGTIEKNSNASVWVLHKNTNISRETYSDFIQKAQEANVEIVLADAVAPTEGTEGNINISYQAAGRENELAGVNMFVLVPPLAPSKSAQRLAQNIGVQLNPWGFFDKQSGDSHPIHTSREGIFVCGSALEPKGIDDAAIQACAAASHAAALLSKVRGTAMAPPPEKQSLPITSEEEPSIAALICKCGPNIGGLLDINALAEYTASLPHVNQVELAPFGCDGVKIREMLRGKEFNRVLVGGCSPKTHEEVFAMHTEGGGINRYLMEIVNLRNHCTWVHSTDPKEATEKAKTLMRMGASRVALQEPLEDIHIPVSPAALVIGGTPSGVACALKLAQADLQVYLVEKEIDLNAVKANQSSFVNRLIEALAKLENARVFTGAELGAVQGFMGNFNAEIVTSAGKEEVDIGSIVIATDLNMAAPSDNGDYEAQLFLQRSENNFFVGMLGNLNPLDFNTAGVFKCGPARMEMGVLDAIMDGEGAASRVAGIISKTEMVKSPIISVVVDEKCDGCAYCIEPCPAHAVALIEYMQHDGTKKKTVEVNDAVCLGCGNCMATCPKDAVYIQNFKPEQIMEMVHSVSEEA